MHKIFDLKEMDADEADIFIAVTDSDELNLLCCIIAKKEGDCRTIARLKNPEYTAQLSVAVMATM